MTDRHDRDNEELRPDVANEDERYSAEDSGDEAGIPRGSPGIALAVGCYLTAALMTLMVDACFIDPMSW